MKKLIFTLLFTFLFMGLAGCAEDASQPPELATKKEELKKIAITAKEKGDFTQAANLENQIIGLDIKDPDSFINLAKTLKKQHKPAEALDILQTGEKLIPNNEKLQFQVGLAFLENDRFDDAINKLESIKTLRNKEYYNTLGVAYDLSGNHELAQDTFQQGLEQSPNDGLLLNNLALSYIFDHNPNEAIKILKNLVKRPGAPVVKYHHNLALAYGLSGHPEEATKILDKEMSKKDAADNLQIYKQMKEDE